MGKCDTIEKREIEARAFDTAATLCEMMPSNELAKFFRDTALLLRHQNDGDKIPHRG